MVHGKACFYVAILPTYIAAPQLIPLYFLGMNRVVKQRIAYKHKMNGKKSPMTQHKIHRLEKLGFSFSTMNGKRLTQRMRRDLCLGAIIEPKGSSLVGESASSINTAHVVESNWAKPETTTLDSLHKLAVDTLLAQQQPIRDTNWESMYEQLKDFKEDYGHSFVPVKLKSGKTELGNWVVLQRAAYKKMKEGKKSSMKQERLDKLKELDFAFNARDTDVDRAQDEYYDYEGDAENAWCEYFERLKKYKEDNGEFNVPVADRGLLRWVETQRRHYSNLQLGKHSPMTAQRLMRLTTLGFSMVGGDGLNTLSDYQFEEGFEKLRQFKLQHGTCNVSSKPYTPLLNWVNSVRKEYRKLQEMKTSKLTAEQVQRLNELGFVVTPKTQYRPWQSMFKELQEYQSANGHINVPMSYGKLGRWLNQQHAEHRRLLSGKYSVLTQERVQMLTDIGMVWRNVDTEIRRVEQKSWTERFEELLQFKRESGHTIVPQKYPQLGQWVHKQRVLYKRMKQGRDSLMTPDKALKLAEIGFVFDVRACKTDVARTENSSKVPSIKESLSAWHGLQESESEGD